MGISVALMLAAASPAALPAQVVAVPLAADPALLIAQAGLRRPVITWSFDAPARSPDLRHLRVAPVPRSITARPVGRFAYFVPAPIANADDERRLDTLVRDDPEARVTGRRLRRSTMAAGLSFKVVQADGILSPLLGMSGPVGKALTRIAIVAVQGE